MTEFDFFISILQQTSKGGPGNPVTFNALLIMAQTAKDQYQDEQKRIRAKAFDKKNQQHDAEMLRIKNEPPPFNEH